ncbi:hypothetical protein HY030_02680 [Candidatus Gottesmanbacteria bacterium]|nr:hypothetical protein [Candidatus Gottesmanbacteria bacterium]
MVLNTEAIEEFKRLYFNQYGINLTNEQAVEYGTRLIRMVKAVYGDNLPNTRFDNKMKVNNNIYVSK